MGHDAIALLRTMQGEGVSPDAVTYASVLTACRPTPTEAAQLKKRAARKRAARRSAPVGGRDVAADAMTTPGAARAITVPDVHVSAQVSDAWLVGEPTWRKGLALLSEMRLRGVRPNAVVYGAAIDLCAQSCDATSALHLLTSMKDVHGLDPDSYCYVSAVRACARVGDSKAALRILHECDGAVETLRGGGDDRSGGMGGVQRRSQRRPSPPPWHERLYSAVMLACAEDGLPLTQTLGLLERMRSRGLRPTRHTYAIALDACSRQGGWDHARALIARMSDDGYAPARADFDLGLRSLVAAIRAHGTRLPGNGPLEGLEGVEESLTHDEVRDLAARCGIASPSASMIHSATTTANRSAAARAHARELLGATGADSEPDEAELNLDSATG